jgi:hypothetical protein
MLQARVEKFVGVTPILSRYFERGERLRLACSYSERGKWAHQSLFKPSRAATL